MCLCVCVCVCDDGRGRSLRTCLGLDRCCLRLRLGGLQQQLLTALWREEGRAMRTTAMVISSFLCCWLPFFLSLLPLEVSGLV